MIHLQDIQKTYGTGAQANHVLRGVDLDIADGAFVALVGTSGSGKSTLLNIIGALDRDYSGVASIAGQDLHRLNDRDTSRFRNRTVGFIFQQFHLLPHLPVSANVSMPSWFDPSQDGAKDRARVLEALERVGLAHKVDAKPLHLSGGERQRVAIARALFNRPKLLLCDEPTGALDTATSDQVMAVFEGLHRDGLTLVMVTHEAEIAVRAQRVVRMRDGQIVDEVSV